MSEEVAEVADRRRRLHTQLGFFSNVGGADVDRGREKQRGTAYNYEITHVAVETNSTH